MKRTFTLFFVLIAFSVVAKATPSQSPQGPKIFEKCSSADGNFALVRNDLHVAGYENYARVDVLDGSLEKVIQQLQMDLSELDVTEMVETTVRQSRSGMIAVKRISIKKKDGTRFPENTANLLVDGSISNLLLCEQIGLQ